jgi:hypothetical protein
LSLNKKFREFKDWCPEPPSRFPTKLKHYSIPIVAIITVTLIFSASLSIFPNLVTHPSLPQIIVPLSSTTGVNETPPAIAWVRNYTGITWQEEADYASRVIQTNEGGYAIAGVVGAHKYSVPEGWLVKIDAQGNIQWNQTFVVNSENLTYKLSSIAGLVQTQDGGYVIAGTEASDTSSDYATAPTYFAILFKTDSTGNIEWNQTYSQLGGASFMVQTTDGGYAVTGDYSLIKANSLGKIQWQKSYEDSVFKGNSENENIISVQQTADGGYALLTSDNILFKVTSTGNLQWQQTYQTGTSYLGQPSYLSSFISTSDSGYLLEGNLYTNNSTDHFATLIKTDSNGKADWSKSYGPLGSSVASLIQTSDNGYSFAGTLPNSGNYPENLIWIVKTDSAGNLQWSQTNNETSESLIDYFLGGAFTANSLIETSDGGFMVAGSWDPGITSLENAYYIAKTGAVLPPPSPTPTYSASSPLTQLLSYPVSLGILAIFFIVIALTAIILLRKRRLKGD